MGGRGSSSSSGGNASHYDENGMLDRRLRVASFKVGNETDEIFSARRDLGAALYKLGGYGAMKNPEDLVYGEKPLGMSDSDYEKYWQLAQVRLSQYKAVVRDYVVRESRRQIDIEVERAMREAEARAKANGATFVGLGSYEIQAIEQEVIKRVRKTVELY